MSVLWLPEIGAADIDSVGGKGASLGELASAGFPVPPGFAVTADTYRDFVVKSGIADELFPTVNTDARERATTLISETPLPNSVRAEILDAYRSLSDTEGDVRVAVRSSATAEDLPEASFAGQQETFLNVTRETLPKRVKDCWASLYTERAIHYRDEHGFGQESVDIAVVVQQMVDAERAGVLFTSDPSTGEPRAIIEAAWGLGGAVVSGVVSPDTYVFDRQRDEIASVGVADKRVMRTRDDATGETVEVDVPEERREERVLTDDEIRTLVDLGERIEDYYGTPQDIEWAMVDGECFVLQSRPITTILDGEADDTDGSTTRIRGTGDVLLRGLGASPSLASGPVRVVTDLDKLDAVAAGDILVTESTTPEMVPALKRSAGIVTDEGGMISHTAIVARELDIPAVVGCGDATSELSDGAIVTVDGDRGTVHRGDATEDVE